jgi:DNA-binding SARP family transcriptional activator
MLRCESNGTSAAPNDGHRLSLARIGLGAVLSAAHELTQEPRLDLLCAFHLSSGGLPMSMTLPAQRLLAFLALQNRAVHRDYVAGTLWLDATEEHAAGSLRSALWRLRKSGLELVDATDHQLQLAQPVVVDVRQVSQWAHEVLDGSAEVDRRVMGRIPHADDLLPGWYDDWVLVERERLRELVVHALECLCGRLAARRLFAHALEAGLAAVQMDPLRESGHRCVIEVHLAEGNKADAVRQYGLFRRLLRSELDLEPSNLMTELVGDLIRR